jgi:Flp pilus assembly protein TadG
MNNLTSEPKDGILTRVTSRILKSGRQNSTAFAKTRSRLKRAAGNQRGQSLVEFTFALPVLVLLMTGMTSFGFALHNSIILTNAVNAGAQQLAFSRGQTTDPCATANAVILYAAPSLSGSISLTYVISGTTYTSSSCTGGVSKMAQGATVQITGTYPCVLAVYGQTYSPCNLKAQVSEVIQ